MDILSKDTKSTESSLSQIKTFFEECLKTLAMFALFLAPSPCGLSRKPNLQVTLISVFIPQIPNSNHSLCLFSSLCVPGFLEEDISQ